MVLLEGVYGVAGLGPEEVAVVRMEPGAVEGIVEGGDGGSPVAEAELLVRE